MSVLREAALWACIMLQAIAIIYVTFAIQNINTSIALLIK